MSCGSGAGKTSVSLRVHKYFWTKTAKNTSEKTVRSMFQTIWSMFGACLDALNLIRKVILDLIDITLKLNINDESAPLQIILQAWGLGLSEEQLQKEREYAERQIQKKENKNILHPHRS